MSLPVPLGMTNVHEESNSTAIPEAPLETPLSVPPMDVEFMVKTLAIASNVALQLSPLRLVTEMRLAGSTLGYSAFPLVALTACGFQWSFYGFFAWTISANQGFLMLIYANILGLVLGVYYIATFAKSKDSSKSDTLDRSLSNQVLLLTLLFASELIFCRLSTNVELALLLSGALAAAVSILVSAAPMVALPRIFQTQSIDSLPVDMVVASLASSVLWFWCGSLLGDPWVWMPNLCGVVVGAIQVGVILFFSAACRSVCGSVASGLRTVGNEICIAGEKISPAIEAVVDGAKSLIQSPKPSTGETD